MKKAIRNDGEISVARPAKILEEVGDVLWCITRIAIKFDTRLSEIAQAANINKLEARLKAGKLKHE